MLLSAACTVMSEVSESQSVLHCQLAGDSSWLACVEPIVWIRVKLRGQPRLCECTGFSNICSCSNDFFCAMCRVQLTCHKPSVAAARGSLKMRQHFVTSNKQIVFSFLRKGVHTHRDDTSLHHSVSNFWHQLFLSSNEQTHLHGHMVQFPTKKVLPFPSLDTIITTISFYW